jgi:hypothetical protein
MLILKLIGGAIAPVILWGALLFLPAGDRTNFAGRGADGFRGAVFAARAPWI